ncbi:MAG TPA: glycosyltransferase family 39 protein [Bryobacteraceae bacterium]|nr:glycosyltransferase family 39 protein [Bryobacteraceae bacterium]
MKRRAVLTAAGAAAIVLAVLCSNAFIERAFGRPLHSLAWGPSLFRILLAFHGCVLLCGAFTPAGGIEVRRGPKPAPRVLWTLGALTVAAILLRLPSLNSCLWLDEVLTMARFAKPPLAWIFTSFPDQNQHMLYSLLAHGALRLFGEQAWSIRLPSVLFGAASLWALFLLGRKMAPAARSDAEALLACALMTVSYHHIWFSQNARGYMGLLFFTLLATWLWLEAMDRDDFRLWTAYVICVALGFWIHMTILFVAATHAVIFLLAWLRSKREPGPLARAAGAFILCGTATLQLYALSLPEFLRTGLSEVSPPSEWINPLWVAAESLRSLKVGFAGTAVVVCGGIVAAVGWLDILRRSPRAAWAMVLPAMAGGGSMLALGHNLWPRFFFFSMGFGLLIAIRGAMRLPDLLLQAAGAAPPWGMRAGYAFCGLFVLASLSTVPRAYALPKQDFTGARDYVERELGPARNVAVVGLAAHAYTEYYAPQWPAAESAEQLKALHPDFLVYTLPIELKAAHPDIWQAVQSDFEIVKIFPGTLGGGEVYVCRPHAGAAQR